MIYIVDLLSSLVVEGNSSCHGELVPFCHDKLFSNQTLYFVRPLSFKHVSNEKSLFGWTKIKLFFFISDIRQKDFLN